MKQIDKEIFTAQETAAAQVTRIKRFREFNANRWWHSGKAPALARAITVASHIPRCQRGTGKLPLTALPTASARAPAQPPRRRSGGRGS